MQNLMNALVRLRSAKENNCECGIVRDMERQVEWYARQVRNTAVNVSLDILAGNID